MPRVSEPYFVSISTSRGSTVCALSCVGVAAIDAAQQRIGQPVHGLLPKVPPHQRRHRLSSPPLGRGGMQQIQPHPHLGAQR